MSKKFVVTILMAAVVFGLGCRKLLPGEPVPENVLDGPIDGLTQEQRAQFLRGDIAFNDESFTPETGLGPLFVSTSCGSCHAGDGKGHPFSTLTRFGQTDTSGNRYLFQGGYQLQHRAIPGYTAETLPGGAAFSAFMPPANTGLGFLEAITDQDILSRVDPDDADGDGISGRAAWIDVPSYVARRPDAISQNGKLIGRFGKKSAVYNLLQQTAGAYNQDMGIVSSYEPIDTYSGTALDPEITNQKVSDVVFYLQTLKVPPRRNAENPEVKSGEAVFSRIGCERCHRATFQTAQSAISALSNQAIFPYTDLLLHDMGSALNDGYTEGGALAQEWRTPPLWGLGLSKSSQGGSYFLLHDGRARTIEAAIGLHAGEGSSSREAYSRLTPSDRNNLILFLESL